MKYIIRYVFAATTLLMVLTSCEKVLQFAESTDDVLTLNAVATPDTVLMVSVSKTSSLNGKPRQYQYLDFYDYYQHIDTLYYDQVPKDAIVTYTVNDGEKSGNMEYDDDTHKYISDYRPRPGDNISISADYLEKLSQKKFSAHGSVSVPASAPQFEVVSKVTYYEYLDKGYLDPTGEYDIYATDSVMEITLNLKDTPGVSNYYRLRIRGIAETKNLDGEQTSYVTDIFTTSDVLLQDRTLTEAFGNWPAYFTNIFDDHLFSNGEYTITVKSRMRSGTNPRVLVEYQSITRELYYYLRSVYQYRIHTEDVFYDPISIYTNVDDGWGILGGITSSRVMLYY